MAEGLGHLDESGRARMVDVGEKAATRRLAEAEAFLAIGEAAREALFAGELPKGDALAAARIAGIMAAKRTAELIPLCHPLFLTQVEVEVEPDPRGARVVARAATTERTGVEMEAMTAAAVAALTLYDMVKSLEQGVEVGPVRLLRKQGGRSGSWERS